MKKVSKRISKDIYSSPVINKKIEVNKGFIAAIGMTEPTGLLFSVDIRIKSPVIISIDDRNTNEIISNGKNAVKKAGPNNKRFRIIKGGALARTRMIIPK
jgi:hypothetical protein